MVLISKRTCPVRGAYNTFGEVVFAAGFTVGVRRANEDLTVLTQITDLCIRILNLAPNGREALQYQTPVSKRVVAELVACVHDAPSNVSVFP